jgi:hypothetical protein
MCNLFISITFVLFIVYILYLCIKSSLPVAKINDDNVNKICISYDKTNVQNICFSSDNMFSYQSEKEYLEEKK